MEQKYLVFLAFFLEQNYTYQTCLSWTVKTQDADVNSDIWPKHKSVAAETCLWWPELEFFLAKTFGFVNSMDNSWRNNFLSLRMLLKYDFFCPYDISIESTCVLHLHEKSKCHLFCPPYAWVLSCHLVSCSYSTFCSVVMQDSIRVISPFWADCLIAINLCGYQDQLFFGTYETRAMLSVNPKCLKPLPFRSAEQIYLILWIERLVCICFLTSLLPKIV